MKNNFLTIVLNRVIPNFAVFLALSFPLCSSAQIMFPSWVLGSWTGSARTESEETRLRINVIDVNGELSANVDLLDLGVIGIPAQQVSVLQEELLVVIPSDGGPQNLRMTLDSSGVLAGTWSENEKEDALIELSHSNLIAAPKEQIFIIDGPVGQLGVSILAPENQLAQAGVVFVHGSGDASRDASRFAAIMLAENGIASAIFDKRGVGESEGDWHLADFNDLAADVLAVTQALEEQTGLGGNQIGFIGTSQGGWIAPLVASRRSITPFVISIAGPATTPAEEGHWNVVRDLRNAGYDSEAILEADAVMSAWDEGVRQNGDFQLFRNSLEMTRNKEWFEDSGLEQRFTTDFPEWFISWYQGIMDFNPIPVLRQLDMPFLSIMGDQDEEQPWDRSAMLYRELAAEGQDFTVRIYENVGHSMRYLNLDGSSQRWPSRPIDFYSLQLEFIQQSTN